MFAASSTRFKTPSAISRCIQRTGRRSRLGFRVPTGRSFLPQAGKLLAYAIQETEAGAGGKRGLVEDITVPLAGYLAMFGTPEERRIIADDIMAGPGHSRWNLTPWLARFAVDPTIIAVELVEGENNNRYRTPAVCPYHRLRGETAFDAIMDNAIAAYANHRVITKDYVTPVSQAYHSGDIARPAYIGPHAAPIRSWLRRHIPA